MCKFLVTSFFNILLEVSTCNDKIDLIHGDENDETKNINETNCDKKPNRHIKIFFKNSQQQILSVYKCILLNKKKELLLNDNLVDIFNNRIINPQKWMIVMLSKDFEICSTEFIFIFSYIYIFFKN